MEVITTLKTAHRNKHLQGVNIRPGVGQLHNLCHYLLEYLVDAQLVWSPDIEVR